MPGYEGFFRPHDPLPCVQVLSKTVSCPDLGTKFECVEYSFEPIKTDRAFLDSLIADGQKLAAHVNPTLARDSSQTRAYYTIVDNCIAGVIAEYCWRDWLNKSATKFGAKVVATTKLFDSIDKHVDIEMRYSDGGTKTVEVRSSFPYKGLQEAVCRNFDIIGWYVNRVKRLEIRKDYYARTLYPFLARLFKERIQVGPFSAFLTGGASKNLLETSTDSRDKAFVPYDDVDSERSSENATYRVVEPIIKAYDTPRVTELILTGKS